MIQKLAKLPRRAVRALGESFGFEVSEKMPPFNPFIRRFEFTARPFDFWIASRDAEKWYRETPWREALEYAELKRLVRPGDRILEIGSHHGFTGMLLSELAGPQGSVLGLEAQPANAVVAMAQLTLNLQVENLRFVHAAGGATDGTLRVSDWHNSCVVVGAQEGAEVKMVAGDNLDRAEGPFDLLKVDVEGFECSVLQGCKELLARKPRLAIELHVDLLPRYGTSLAEFLALIGAERYAGTMLVRARPREVLPFEPAAIPSGGIVNLFLQPRGGREGKS